MRVHVTGNAGAGKTTLANRIGHDFALPVFGLDRIVWQPGWQKTEPAVRDRLEQELIARPEWVIEGVSHHIRRAADITIFLDVPESRCFRRAAVRSLKYLFSGRPELPFNCPEYKILPRLGEITSGFTKRVRPVILEDQSDHVIIVINDPDDYDAEQLNQHFSVINANG